jgi:hypothetical protein
MMWAIQRRAEADSALKPRLVRAGHRYLWGPSQAHAAYIRHCVGALMAADREVSAQLAAATEDFGSVVFDESPIPGIDDHQPPRDAKHAGVQLAGYGIPLPDEPPPPDPGLPPGGWSKDEATKEAQKIAYGHAWEHWKNVPGMTKDRLTQLVHDMMAGNPKTDPDLFVGQTPEGSTVIYKDGIAVFYDHNKSWDGGTVSKPDHGFDDFLRLSQLTAVSSVVDVVAGHVDGLAPIPAGELADWVAGLAVPAGWQVLPPDATAAPLARIAVRGRRPGGGWDACDTISVFRFTGFPPDTW